MGSVANYGLIDATLVPDEADLLDLVERRSLYKGETAEHLADYAPYVVPIADREVRDALARTHGARMIFLQCPLEIVGLQRHLRKFLIVRDHARRQFYFRYYDPFVLRVFLPTCSQEQLASFFGPIETIWIAEEDDRTHERYLAYRRADDGLEKLPELWAENAASPLAVGGRG